MSQKYVQNVVFSGTIIGFALGTALEAMHVSGTNQVLLYLLSNSKWW